MRGEVLDLSQEVISDTSEHELKAFPPRPTPLLAGALCILFALYAGIVPLGRACLRLEIAYNEGWNVYNANTVAQHRLLYPAAYAWRIVNYPPLSFYLFAELQRFTHDFLFTARAVSVLSTLLCSLLAGLIVLQLVQRRWPALLAGAYCYALFCASGEHYVGMDDPQMLSQVFLMAGLLVYVRHRQKLWALACVALLFVIGLSMKQILIEFPLAVMLDLLIVSRRKALQFALMGGALAGLSVVLAIHFGGPAFLPVILAPRSYQLAHMFSNMTTLYQPIVVPGLVALVMAIRYRKHPDRRIVTLVFGTAVLTAIAFGGGSGVWINVLFGGMLMLAVLVGFFFGDLENWANAPTSAASAAPLFLFAWLLIPLGLSGNWRPVKRLTELRAAEQRFSGETKILAAQPGPVLCESMLLCYYAQKPYVYDAFNATRLIRLGKLDPQVMAAKLQRHDFGAVQFDRSIAREYEFASKLLWVPDILQAVEENYVPLLENEDGAIYVPKPETRPVSSTRTSPQTQQTNLQQSN
jgi:hypothetical protein